MVTKTRFSALAFFPNLAALPLRSLTHCGLILSLAASSDVCVPVYEGDGISRLTQSSRYSLKCPGMIKTADLPASYIVKHDVPCTDSVL